MWGQNIHKLINKHLNSFLSCNFLICRTSNATVHKCATSVCKSNNQIEQMPTDALLTVLVYGISNLRDPDTCIYLFRAHSEEQISTGRIVELDLKDFLQSVLSHFTLRLCTGFYRSIYTGVLQEKCKQILRDP